jgi:hypothetical protein
MNAIAADAGDEHWPESAVPALPVLAAEVARFASAAHWDRAALAALLGGPAAPALVVTGQQPAVGGGPLYTLVKVAHAVSLARALGAAAGGVAPLFWCASEDHDLGGQATPTSSRARATCTGSASISAPAAAPCATARRACGTPP